MSSELVGVSFRSDDRNFDWQSVVNTQSGYEFIGSKKIENRENPNWPKWTIIINYKINKNGKN
jgi:hypothetical protein